MKSMENACCSNEKLHALVSGTLVAQEEQVIEQHLDACTTCQRKLEQAAADADSWSEASAFLQDDPWRSSFVGEPPDATSPNALPIQQTLELLGPTDDPGMLGRIGVYEISGVIGSGGMGVVLKGVDRSLDRVDMQGVPQASIHRETVESMLTRILDWHNKQVEAVLDRLETTKRTADLCIDDTYVVKQKFIEAERKQLERARKEWS